MSFHLQIVTPDKLCFDGEAQKVIVRTVEGDVCILPHHIDFVAALGIGECKVTDADGNVRVAACASGLLGVSEGSVRVLPTTFEWKDEIDAERAEHAREVAEERIKGLLRGDEGFDVAEAKLKRALTRLQVRN